MLAPLIFALVPLFFGAKIPPAEPQMTTRHERPAGAASYGRERLDSLTGFGLIKLNGTEVLDLNVKGSLISKDARTGSFEVSGEANLRDTIVNGRALVIGSLQASGSTFNDLLTICTQKAVFTHTRISNLTIRNEPSYKGKQTLELKQHTIISGPIHFESGRGEIIVDSTSQVQGKVTGGKVIYKN